MHGVRVRKSGGKYMGSELGKVVASTLGQTESGKAVASTWDQTE
jgi:hypothetical protein